MKKLFLLFALLATVTMGMGQIKVLSNGNTGIGMQPDHKFSVNVSGNNKFHLASWINAYIDQTGPSGAFCFYPQNDWNLHLGKSNQKLGDIYTHSLYYSVNCSKISDENIKENIKRISNPIEKFKRISAYRYNLKENFLPDSISPEIRLSLLKTQIGFLAQELEKEFPELVVKPSSENEYYSVNYIDMIPILLEAIKEQQNQIEQQDKEVEILQKIAFSQENELTEQRHILQQLQELIYTCCSEPQNIDSTLSGKSRNIQEKAILYQNTPNPFSSNTEIVCYIPKINGKAFLYIYNLQGVELKSYPLLQTGLNNVLVQASELSAGMYLYVLVIDNEIFDSKRMILTK